MPQPVCVECKVEFRCEEAGILLIETCQNDERPYKVWSADVYKCRGCGREILHGYSSQPNWIDGRDEYEKLIQMIRTNPSKRVVFDYEHVQTKGTKTDEGWQEWVRKIQHEDS